MPLDTAGRRDPPIPPGPRGETPLEPEVTSRALIVHPHAASDETGADGRIDASFQARVETLIVTGTVRVGDLIASREHATLYENPDLVTLLRTPHPIDTQVEALEGCQVSFLDVDTHDWTTKPNSDLLDVYAANLWPRPDLWWRTHGHGIRGVYSGPYHRERAIAAAFSVPSCFTVDVLTTTRHPNAPRSDKPGARCGPVLRTDSDPRAEFTFKLVGALTPELRDQALARLGLAIGERADHDRCPITPHAATDARDCVHPYDHGVVCFRCRAHGLRYRPWIAPGYVPYSAIVGFGASGIEQMVEHRVHWTHARFEWRHRYPRLSEELHRQAYESCLRARLGRNDPRIRNVFDAALDFVRGDHVWLRTSDFSITTVDTDAADSLPYTQYVVTNDDSDPVVLVDKARRSQVKHRTPLGYTPVLPYRGILFAPRSDRILVKAPPEPTYPIRLLENPLPVDNAFAKLDRAFAGINRTYLLALIAGRICAEVRGGKPPQIVATGVTGSGKGETINVAASICGDEARKIQLVEDAEVFMRNLGMVLAVGCRFIVIDETGKTPGLLLKSWGNLLQIGAHIDWRPLFQNNRVRTECRAVIAYPTTFLPDFLTSSPEFARRTRAIHLHRKVPVDWERTCDPAGTTGESTRWRDLNKDNAFVANSILTHAWKLAHDCNFCFV